MGYVQIPGGGDTTQDTTEWTADLSSVGYDWKAAGDGSQDPTSGIYVTSTDLADFTTLAVSGGVITFDVSASGADKETHLTVLTDLPDMYLASALYLEADIDLVNDADNFDTTDDVIAFALMNGATAATTTERIIAKIDKGTNIRLTMTREVNDAGTNSAQTDITNPKNPGRLQAVDNVGHQYTQFYETTAHALTQSGALTQTTQHCRTGGGVWFDIWIRAKNGGRVAGTISNLKATVR